MPKLSEKILRWVTDKNGLLKYMDEKYYNPKRPENQCIRRVDKENMELYILGAWIKHDNMTALNKIINILGIDWSTLIAILKYDYSDDYDNNKIYLRDCSYLCRIVRVQVIGFENL